MSTPFSQAAAHSAAKPIPPAPGATAHPPPEEHHVNADLYRTFSPSDVAMWDIPWRGSNKAASGSASGLSKTPSGLWSRLFGKS
ncbi:hypothetical protein HT031_003887 [Scenedesmus sp. PABB004]|nr:hypothetical protein HT031_003887 [Scenedesmus sp. PABB004]